MTFGRKMKSVERGGSLAAGEKQLQTRKQPQTLRTGRGGKRGGPIMTSAGQWNHSSRDLKGRADREFYPVGMERRRRGRNDKSSSVEGQGQRQRQRGIIVQCKSRVGTQL